MQPKETIHPWSHAHIIILPMLLWVFSNYSILSASCPILPCPVPSRLLLSPLDLTRWPSPGCLPWLLPLECKWSQGMRTETGGGWGGGAQQKPLPDRCLLRLYCLRRIAGGAEKAQEQLKSRYAASDWKTKR